jgi:hypothetical protein
MTRSRHRIYRIRAAVIWLLCVCSCGLRGQTAPVNAAQPNGFIRIIKQGAQSCGMADKRPTFARYYVAAVSTITDAVVGTTSQSDGSFVLLPQLVARGNWQVNILDNNVTQVSANEFKAQGSGHGLLIDRPFVCVVDPRETGGVIVRQPVVASYFLPPADDPAKTLRGQLLSNGAKPILARVRLYGIAAGRSTMVELGRTRSNSTGEFTFDISKPEFRDYRFFFVAAQGRRGLAASRFVYLSEAVRPVVISLTRESTDPVAGAIDIFSASRSVLFSSRELMDLPLAGARSYDSLALLAPGVMLAPATFGRSGPGLSPGVGTAGQFSANGLPSRQNNFMVDGADNNDEEVGVRRQGFALPAAQTPESVQEVQVISALADARYGRAIGARVNTLTLSGARSLHGDAYGFAADRRMNARNFFDEGPRPGTSVLTRPADGGGVLLNGTALMQPNPITRETPFTRYEAGLALSGPASFSEQPKTFFSVAFDERRERGYRQAHFAVPTVDDRGFQQSGGRGFDAATVGQFPLPIPMPSSPASLAGNAVFSLFPFPNDPTGVYGANTYTTELRDNGDSLLGSAKLDRYFHKKFDHTLTLRYSMTSEDSDLPSPDGSIDAALLAHVRTRSLATFFNTVLGKRAINSFRFSWGDSSFVMDPAADPSMLPSAAFPGGQALLNKPLLLNATLPTSAHPQFVTSLPGVPYRTTEQVTGPLGQVIVAGFSPVGIDSYHFPQRRGDSTFQFSDSLTVLAGKSSFVGGFDLWYTRLNSDLDRNSRPLLEFWGQRQQFLGPAALYNPATTPEPLMGPTTFVAMGLPQAFRQTLTAPNPSGTPFDTNLGLHRKQIDFLVQHEYKIRPNFRIVAGARLGINRLPESSDGRFESGFDRNLFNSEIAASQSACGQLGSQSQGPNQTASSACLSRVTYLAQAFPPGFQQVFGASPFYVDPRIGFAWSFDKNGSWVLRGGWGRYSGQFPAVILNESRSTFPQSLALDFRTPTLSNGLLFNISGTNNDSLNLVSKGSLSRLAANDPVAVLAQKLLFYDVQLENVLPASGLKDPYSMQYGVTLEHKLFADTVVSLAYVGTAGRHLLRVIRPDPYGPAMPDLVFVSTFGPLPVFNSTNVERSDPTGTLFLTPTLSRTFLASSANSNYNSLQADFRGRHLPFGLGYGAAFTWSHSIDTASDFFDNAGAPALPQDNLRSSERGSSNFDARLRFAGHFLWTPPVKGRLLGGWQLAGIFQSQTGPPFTVNSVYDVNQDGLLTDRLYSTQGLRAGGPDRRTALTLNSATGFSTNQLLAPAERVLGPTGCLAGLPLGSANPCDGVVGRNTFRGAGMFTMDTSLARTFAVAEDVKLVVRIEAFNAFNRANFAIPVRVLEAPSFGQAVSTVTPNRLVQIVVRLRF